MGSSGLRDFIAALERTGDLVRIKQQVDWDVEAGAISRRTFERGGPCLWFQNIKDYPEGFTLLNGPVAVLALPEPTEYGASLNAADLSEAVNPTVGYQCPHIVGVGVQPWQLWPAGQR